MGFRVEGVDSQRVQYHLSKEYDLDFLGIIRLSEHELRNLLGELMPMSLLGLEGRTGFGAY